MKNQSKRGVIQKMAMGGLMATSFQKVIVTPVTVQLQQDPGKVKIRFGICANIPRDAIDEGELRLKVFINDMQKQNVDFIIQLGDFCIPYEKNHLFLKIWGCFQGPRYHVLGHYDIDKGLASGKVIEFNKASCKYYSFDINGYHFIVLNGNEHNPSVGRSMGYARYIGKEQQEWLKKDLQHTTLPTILFCYQRLDSNSKGIENAAKIRLILERANHDAGFKKVRFVFSGNYTDHQNEIKGIYYIQVNSMSYQWFGNTYVKFRYSIEMDKNYVNPDHVAPYKKYVYTRAEIENGDALSLRFRTSLASQQKN